MAETLGSLLDKLSIETIRMEKMKMADLPPLIVTQVSNKIESLKNEIDSYLLQAINGKAAIEEPKFKFYKNENPSKEKFENIAEAFSKLIQANYTLWNLEDVRRDKSLNDETRLQASDDVGKWNRVRNDTMDHINSILSSLINNNLTK